jgi:hypothetical protein
MKRALPSRLKRLHNHFICKRKRGLVPSAFGVRAYSYSNTNVVDHIWRTSPAPPPAPLIFAVLPFIIFAALLSLSLCTPPPPPSFLSSRYPPYRDYLALSSGSLEIISNGYFRPSSDVFSVPLSPLIKRLWREYSATLYCENIPGCGQCNPSVSTT